MENCPEAPVWEEKDMIILRNIHQPAQLALRLLENIQKHLGSMAHLHHRHTGAPVVGDFGPARSSADSGSMEGPGENCRRGNDS